MHVPGVLESYLQKSLIANGVPACCSSSDRWISASRGGIIPNMSSIVIIFVQLVNDKAITKQSVDTLKFNINFPIVRMNLRSCLNLCP